ncbi:TPA: FAD-binding protein [Vibrio parahaemolyticus]|uniref:FAD-binding oxidoreductase n=1 Tax=Vibrio parahaemolyticus TaxID=670 RepID=UPI0003F9114B|nr:FAD-binding oxidoreductase [Vibrio parahaemolyticus]EHH3731509.1 FAD-binding oxidoreductase [Vibrio parahaemolyticus]EIU6782002.1 FAD-binding oxidoreductase [Vibrio parahaemolyticus]MCC3815402.1 FAD-binding oxidoreductase [Vibrio parahaemolyticus]MCC3852055.1 FAD-binding oxidoreductase [Vibrio parahaemolyticus]
MKQLTSWGNYPRIESYQHYAEKTKVPQISNVAIARGLGRSYGDSALSENVILSERLNRFSMFTESGLLTCDAGMTLGDILETFVPKGWFLPVTPGTKFVTVGGAIASDVHGKNHHSEGCFSDHVLSMVILIDQSQIYCDREQNADLFYATCGGMGLTGVVIEATIQLKKITSSYIDQKIIKAENLETVLKLFNEHEHYTYSVAWIDCLSTGEQLGRSILMLGEHAKEGELKAHTDSPISIPFHFPSFILNKYSIQSFNFAYYHRLLKSEINNVVHYDPFFYPLDGIQNWNRMYGKEGFTQYQFVIPYSAGSEGLTKILTKIAESKQGSFLAVLKVFGESNNCPLSFPMKGYTLALDFKLDEKLFPLLEQFDAIVREFGGRLYLSKDVRMSEDMFKSGYPKWNEFQSVREKYDCINRYSSLQSKRIGL